ncbi:hypothetical protein AB1L42_12910 [Thalassoglobus sp. JC818]|uniref:hypothetical protein n=1 Tax=Thalassoglobus sp. JC818 TaxID=3232136 RepID=UPI0034598481
MNQNPQLRRCTELEYILLGDLRDLLEEPADNETARWLVAVLDALLEALPEEYSLKTRQGYLSDVVESVPEWDNRVTALEDEYFRLFRRLGQLRSQVVLGVDFQRVAKQVSIDLKDWMTAFVSHHQQERELVSMAATYEVGGNG